MITERDPVPPAAGDGSGPSAPAPPPEVLEVDLDWRTVALTLVAALAVSVVARALVLASVATTLVVIAVFLALALDPLVTQLQRRGLARGLATTTVVLVATAAFAAFVALAGPELVSQSRNLEQQLPRTAESMTSLPLIGPRLAEWDVPEKVTEFLSSVPERVASEGADLGSLAARVSFTVGAVVLGFLLMVGVLLEGPRMVGLVRAAVPPSGRGGADDIGRIVYRVVARYFAGSLLIAFLNGIWVASTALLAGVPLAPVLAVWAALTSLIPQIGGLLGFAVVLLVSLSAGIGPALIMAAAFLFFMLLTNHVLQPTIIGSAVQLSAPVTMLSALGGFAVAGVVGALFVVPTVGAVKAVVQHARGIDPPPDQHALSERARHLLHRVRRRGGEAGADAGGASS